MTWTWRWPVWSGWAWRTLLDKLYTQISGGERQMVLIARALAQEPEMLVMDEPTASLDYGNQVKVLRQISRLAREGMSIIMTTHFPDHAFLCASKVGLITRDWVRFGDPDDVVTEQSFGRDVWRGRTHREGAYLRLRHVERLHSRGGIRGRPGRRAQNGAPARLGNPVRAQGGRRPEPSDAGASGACRRRLRETRACDRPSE